MTDDLQAIAADGWGFAEREHLGGWQLRAAGGYTNRANSVWPLGDPGLPLPEALAEVRRWYAERGLPAQIQTVVGGELDRRIAALGHDRAENGALRQVGDIGHALAALRTATVPAGAEITAETTAGITVDITVDITKQLPADFSDVYRRGATEHPRAATVLNSGDAEPRFAVVRDPDGAALAVGRIATSAATGWAGLGAIHTAERARRRGLARVVLRELLTTAEQSGATRAYLEVMADNGPALSLYSALGFRTGHEYHCRVLST